MVGMSRKTNALRIATVGESEHRKIDSNIADARNIRRREMDQSPQTQRSASEVVTSKCFCIVLTTGDTIRMRVARSVVLDKQSQRALEQLARGRSLPARLVERATHVYCELRRACRINRLQESLGLHGRKRRGGATVIWTVPSKRSRKMLRGLADHPPSTLRALLK